MELERRMVYVFVMRVPVSNYPQLHQLCWNRPDAIFPFITPLKPTLQDVVLSEIAGVQAKA